MKKIIAFTAALTVLCSMTACSTKRPEESSAESLPQTVTVSQTIYQQKPIEIDAEIAFVSNLSKCGDMYYLFYTDYESAMKLTRLDSSYNVIDTLSFENSGAVCTHDDGGFTMVSMSTDFSYEIDENGELTNYDEYLSSARLEFKLTDYDSTGTLVSETVIDGLEESYDKENSRLNSLYTYGDGYLLFFDTGAAVINKDGTIGELQQFRDHYNIQTAIDTYGKIIVADLSGYHYIEGEKLNIPSEFTPLSSERTICGVSTGFGDFKAFIGLIDGIYGLTPNEELVLVLDYNSSLISQSEIDVFIPCGDGEFMAYNRNKLYVYSRRPDDYRETRQRLDMWQIGRDDDQPTVTEFNKSSDKYFISCSGMRDFTELKNAVLTGEAPDIIFYDNVSYMDDLINLGALADMGQLLDSGNGLSRDGFMPNVIEAIERKGGIYILPQYFNVCVCFTDKSFIGEEYADWSFDEFIDLCNSRPDGMYLAYDLAGFDPFTAVCCANSSSWIDRENAACSFDSPEFIKLINFFKDNKELCPESDAVLNESIGTLKNRHAMLSCSGFSPIALNRLIDDIALCGLKDIDEAALLNYPGGNGKGQIELRNCWSILETSDCKDGAWEFVSYALSSETMNNPFLNSSNKSLFEQMLESRLQKGDEPEMHTISRNDSEIEYIYSLTEEQAQKYRDFVENCTSLRYNDYDIHNILWEEYQRFLNDEISDTECAKRIQNRVSIYLSENS